LVAEGEKPPSQELGVKASPAGAQSREAGLPRQKGGSPEHAVRSRAIVPEGNAKPRRSEARTTATGAVSASERSERWQPEQEAGGLFPR